VGHACIKHKGSGNYGNCSLCGKPMQKGQIVITCRGFMSSSQTHHANPKDCEKLIEFFPQNWDA